MTLTQKLDEIKGRVRIETPNRTLSMLTMRGRGMGKTTAASNACKEIGAALLCHNRQEAERVNKVHGCRTLYLEQNLDGIDSPVLVDTHTVSVAAGAWARREKELTTDLKTLIAVVRVLDVAMDKIQKYKNGTHGKNDNSPMVVSVMTNEARAEVARILEEGAE